MFRKFNLSLNAGVLISSILVCILIFLTLVPYSISCINRDFEEKSGTLAKQYSACLDTKFENIQHSAKVVVSEYGSLFTAPNPQIRSTNAKLDELRKGNQYLEGIAVVTPNTIFASGVYYGGTTLYSNFGKHPFEKLSESTQVHYIINNEVLPEREDNKMIYTMPVLSDGIHPDYYVLIFFNPLKLIRNFKFEQSWFLSQTSIVIVTKDTSIFQMRERPGEPLVNSERRLSELPKKKPFEYTVSYPTKNETFSSIFYINKSTVVFQSFIIIVGTLLLLVLACLLIRQLTHRYSRLCELRLNKLIDSMDKYILQHTEEVSND